jgi:DNA-directed RNA polymerase subunit RPC12/RpoP
MSWHEMACDAGYGPNNADHAEMEAMAEAQARHEFEMQCEAEAAEQAQAGAAQAEKEAAQYSAQQAQECPSCGHADCKPVPIEIYKCKECGAEFDEEQSRQA